MCDNSKMILRSCIFNVAASVEIQSCLYVCSMGRVFAFECEFYNTYGRLLTVTNMSSCVLMDCTGKTNASYAFSVTEGSDFRTSGSRPSGSVSGSLDTTASYV